MCTKDNHYDIAIIGCGPAGIFTAYKLITENPKLNIAVIDKGKHIIKRKCPMRDNPNLSCVKCNPCNIMSGFGGAGTFSDCKLSLTPFGVGGDIVEYVGGEEAVNLIQEVDNIYASFDKDADKRVIIGTSDNENITKIKELCSRSNLKYTECPTKHLGTDGTYDVMVEMQRYLEDKNVKFYFNTEVEVEKDVINNKFKISTLVKYNISKESLLESITADYVVMAPGRSGNSWLARTAQDLNLTLLSNKVDVGVRVETSAEIMQFLTDNLYDVKLSYENTSTGDKVRTFCTNPKGFVSEEHYGKWAVVNGHSFADKKSNNTNFALLVTLNDDSLNLEYIKRIVEQANQISKGKLILQNCCDFMACKATKSYDEYKESKTDPTLKTAMLGDLNLVLPARVTEMIKTMIIQMNKQVAKYIRWSDTWLYGIEAKFYSNKLQLSNTFETEIPNLYGIGDGVGVTRGITQAASSGLVVAKDILNKVK